MTQTQSYRLTFSRFSPSLSVASFTAAEALNTAYRLDIELTSVDSDLPLSSYINQAVKFTVTPVSSDALGLIEGMIAPQALKEWSGIITSCEKLLVSADETRYRMVLEPRIAALKHHRTSRLFQNQNVPDIIASLLKHHGFSGVDFRFNTSREYGVREYVTQYQESDFAFINRLCEEEGIWYAFEQNAQYGEVAVFGDDAAHYFRDNRHLYPYRPHGGLESVGEEAVFALQVKHNPILESIRVGDYNYRDADTDLSSQVTAKDKESDSSVLLGSDSHWGLHQKTPEEAQLQTALLQQLNHSRRIVASGSGNITALSPGQVFQTAPSFSEAPNGWLVVSLTHRGSRGQAYSHSFTAIPADSIFRPERITPLPKIQGSLPARVTSPGNYTYAYIDNMGRYRVKLPFDLDEWSPGGESRPIRLAKPYAGPDYGQHFPLHEGTEVMLSFVQGNPDRPYISGVMHDSSHPDHVPADWNTRNVIRTWANNKLRMEDKQGQEHIKLATEYGKTQLNLGHIVDSERKLRGDDGQGFELRTDHWGSVRAGKGLFLSANAQSAANGEVLDMEATIQQLKEALDMAQGLAKAAKRAETPLGDQDVNSGSKDLMDQGGQYGSSSLSELDAKGLKNAGLIASAPAGIVLSTPKHIQISATENILHTAGNNIHNSVFKKFTVAAGELISFFAQTLGIKMVASKGDITLQAQQDNITVAAAKDIRIDSVNGEITISASKKLTLVCDGSYITLGGGNVEIGTPGQIINKSSGWQSTGPSSKSVKGTMPKVAKGQLELLHYYATQKKDGVAGGEYTVIDSSGQVRKGILDSNGYAVVSGLAEGAAKVVFSKDPRDGHSDKDIIEDAFRVLPIGKQTTSDKNQIAQFEIAKKEVDTLLADTKNLVSQAQALKQVSDNIKSRSYKDLAKSLSINQQLVLTEKITSNIKKK